MMDAEKEEKDTLIATYMHLTKRFSHRWQGVTGRIGR